MKMINLEKCIRLKMLLEKWDKTTNLLTAKIYQKSFHLPLVFSPF